MDDLLPFVNPEICFSLQREVANISDIEFVKRQLKLLKKKNPVIGLWIKDFSKKSKDRMFTMVCALMVYRMLEVQYEIDDMNEFI